MFVNYNNNLFLLAILGTLVISCGEPEYLEVKKSDLPEPHDIWINQMSAFSLQLHWRIPDQDYSEEIGFFIESFSSSDSIFIDSDSAFSMLMNNENTIPRNLMVLNSDTNLVNTSVNDTALFEFIDHSAFYKRWNYYRVMVMFQNIESYSIFTNSGHYFEIPKPENFIVEQLNDFQLKLSWKKLDYADGYIIERLAVNGSDSTTYIVVDDTLIDSSFDPQYTILDTVFAVNGIQPNQLYTYTVSAYADKDSLLRFESNTVSVSGMLSLTAPIIAEIKSIDYNTVRLYLYEEYLDNNFDTLFVMRNDLTGWVCAETLMVGSMDQMFFEYRNQYMIDDRVGHSTNDIEYRLIGKGEINAIASSTVIGRTLDIEGFTFVEGGEFSFGCPTCDTLFTTEVDPFYISKYEYTNDWPIVAGVFPIDSLSWVESVLICTQLSIQHDRIFRLPSEIEWEYAAKWDIISQQEFNYSWKSNSISGGNSNYMNSGDPWDNGLSPTGFYNGNNGTINSYSFFGVYDMGGNVLEWCGSGSHIDDVNNVSGSNYIGTDMKKPLRGGGYWHDPEQLKTTNQFEYDPEIKVLGFGFRIVMEDF